MSEQLKKEPKTRKTKEELAICMRQKAEELKIKELHLSSSTAYLEPFGLRTVHLRNGAAYGLPGGSFRSLSGSPRIALGWGGEDLTVSSIECRGGRVFTIARVNKSKGDHFQRREGRRVAQDRLMKEVQDYSITGEFGVQQNWFYFTYENPGRDTIVYASMVAADAILKAQHVK